MPAFQGNSGRLARFAVFELDLAAGELRRNGAKLRLQEQPFQLLAWLHERAGDVVTREELARSCGHLTPSWISTTVGTPR